MWGHVQDQQRALLGHAVAVEVDVARRLAERPVADLADTQRDLELDGRGRVGQRDRPVILGRLTVALDRWPNVTAAQRSADGDDALVARVGTELAADSIAGRHGVIAAGLARSLRLLDQQGRAADALLAPGNLRSLGELCRHLLPGLDGAGVGLRCDRQPRHRADLGQPVDLVEGQSVAARSGLLGQLGEHVVDRVVRGAGRISLYRRKTGGHEHQRRQHEEHPSCDSHVVSFEVGQHVCLGGHLVRPTLESLRFDDSAARRVFIRRVGGGARIAEGRPRQDVRFPCERTSATFDCWGE